MSTKAEIKRKKELKRKAGYGVKAALAVGLVILGVIYYNSGKGGAGNEASTDTYSIRSEKSMDVNQISATEPAKKNNADTKTGDSRSKDLNLKIDKNDVVSNINADTINIAAPSKSTDTMEENGNLKDIDPVPQSHYDAEGRLNINYATAGELCRLNGIGEKRAADIIEYRDANGGFKKLEDIMKVKGIKQGVFSKIKDYIYID